MKDSNFYEKKENRFILIRSVYGFKPNETAEVGGSFNATFTLSQIMSYIKINFCDENF